MVDLRLLEDADAPELQALIEANREHLARWMPWAAGQSLEDSRRFIRRSRAQLTANDGLQAATVIDDAIVGVIGFHAIDWSNRSTSIGYWLAEAAQGRGLMTEATRVALEHAFGTWELHRVEIRVAPENCRSAAIPTRLGFTVEGRLRDVERLGGGYVDNTIYSMLAVEWGKGGPCAHPQGSPPDSTQLSGRPLGEAGAVYEDFRSDPSVSRSSPPAAPSSSASKLVTAP